MHLTLTINHPLRLFDRQGGETIKKMTEESKTTIKMAGKEKQLPGVPERVMTINGKLDNVRSRCPLFQPLNFPFPCFPLLCSGMLGNAFSMLGNAWGCLGIVADVWGFHTVQLRQPILLIILQVPLTSDLWALDPDHPAGAQGDRHCPSQDLGAKDDELHQHGDIVQGPRGQAQL